MVNANTGATVSILKAQHILPRGVLSFRRIRFDGFDALIRGLGRRGEDDAMPGLVGGRKGPPPRLLQAGGQPIIIATPKGGRPSRQPQ